MYISYFPYFCSCIILCVCTCVCGGGWVTYPLFIIYVYIYILNFIFIRLLLNVKKEIKKKNLICSHFYYIFIPFMKQWKHKVNAKLQRQYMRSFIGPGLFDRRWLVANDGCNFEGLYAPERKKKHFLNIFNDFLILNEAFLRRARDL